MISVNDMLHKLCRKLLRSLEFAVGESSGARDAELHLLNAYRRLYTYVYADKICTMCHTC
jgi:hypothetical protein